MRVAKIIEHKDRWKNHLKAQKEYEEYYKYDCLDNYNAFWDLEELDFAAMYEKSFAGKISHALWDGSHYSPRSVMLLFIAQQKEIVRSCFRDLYMDENDLGLRIKRFIDHCDQMLADLQRKDNKHNTHYHDLKMVTTYLAFEFPEKYCIIEPVPFIQFLDSLDMKNLPQVFESERLIKLSQTVYKIISKDEELLYLHTKLTRGNSNRGVFMMHDFIAYSNN